VEGTGAFGSDDVINGVSLLGQPGEIEPHHCVAAFSP
jgi:hypothetical protein